MNNPMEKMNDPIEQIWSRFSKQLSELICQKTGHQDHCYDILQDVYLKMVKNTDKIGKVDNIRHYLMKLAKNTVIDYYRANPALVISREPSEDLAAAENDINNPTSKLADSYFSELIHALPPIYKQALIRTELEGISQKQLASELGISYSGAKSRVQRAKEILRQSLLNCCDYKFDKYGNVISCCGSDIN
jgi:RNA polymerase sigma-70 factor, ECF subfamily